MFEIVLKNGLVFDGLGGEPYRADLGIESEKIAAIGDLSLVEADQVIDVDGLAVAPGWIDLHTHSDFTLIVNGKAESQVHQGVTTEVVGQCGFSCAPVCRHADIAHTAIGCTDDHVDAKWKTFGEYLHRLEQSSLGVNVAAFVGHGAIHRYVMGDALRLPDTDEVRKMARLVDEAMEQGAAGFSTGLEYWPGSQAESQHIVPLCQVAERHDRLYATHVRNRDRFYDQGFGEALSTARTSGARLQISHIQPKYGAPEHAMEHTLELLDSARGEGVDVCFDIIPHDWAHTLMMAILPKWALEGGIDQILQRLSNTKSREKIKQNPTPMWLLVAYGIWSKIVVLNSHVNNALIGETIADIAGTRKKDPYDVVLDLLLEEGEAMPQLLWTSHSFKESELDLCLQQPECAVISDTLAMAPYGELSQQLGSLSGYGWAPRFLRHFVRERKVLTLEEGIRRLTSLPAARLKLKDRGVIAKGNHADITVFDPAEVTENWSIQQPRRYPDGIYHVFVNGAAQFLNGRRTKVDAGRVLRGPLS